MQRARDRIPIRNRFVFLPRIRETAQIRFSLPYPPVVPHPPKLGGVSKRHQLPGGKLTRASAQFSQSVQSVGLRIPPATPEAGILRAREPRIEPRRCRGYRIGRAQHTQTSRLLPFAALESTPKASKSHDWHPLRGVRCSVSSVQSVQSVQSVSWIKDPPATPETGILRAREPRIEPRRCRGYRIGRAQHTQTSRLLPFAASESIPKASKGHGWHPPEVSAVQSV